MAKLGARQRTQLPDSAFAYVDPTGRRRLPIHDGPHVRNALARFNQVMFESEDDRDRARTRLLKAARKHGIVPIGFVTGQLRAGRPRELPSGQVTLLMTDIVGSTGLLSTLGDGYPQMLADVRRIHRGAVRRSGGQEVDSRADEYFAVFRHATDALAAAAEIRHQMSVHPWPAGSAVALRIGLHSGRPTPAEQGYVGLAVHAVARICALARGSQVVLSDTVVEGLGVDLPSSLRIQSIGFHSLRGFSRQVALHELLPDPS